MAETGGWTTAAQKAVDAFLEASDKWVRNGLD